MPKRPLISFNSWGPAGWIMLHSACLTAYKSADGVRQLADAYKVSLPCPSCRRHWQELLQEYPVPETSSTGLDLQQELFEWSVMVHNQVNIRLGKAEMSVPRALKLYTKSSTFFEDRRRALASKSENTRESHNKTLVEEKKYWIVYASAAGVLLLAYGAYKFMRGHHHQQRRSM